MTLRLDVPAAPALALAPIEYSAFYQDQYSNILRLYFNRLDNALRNVLAGTGGKFLSLPFGAFYDTTDQIAGSTTTAYPITFDSISFENGVTVENSSQITFAYEGVYNIQFSLQFANTDNATQDIDVWFRKNGVDIANSNSRFGLAPRKSVLDPYHVVASLNFVDSFLAGDYVELYWCTSNVLAYIEHYAAGTTPTRPAIPSAILTATFVSSIPE
jgi:hypothetical protein